MSRSIKFVVSATLAGLAFACAGCGPKPAPVAVAPPANSPAPQVMPGPPMVMPGPPVPAPVAETAPTPSAPPTPVEQPGGLIGGQGLPVDPSGSPAPAVPTVVPDPPATPTEAVKADVGVGIKGRSLDQYEGPVVTPAKAYFAIREKVMFQIAIPDAYNKYKAAEEVPLTFAEFKEKVLDPNRIKLPTLPPGHSYEWDPEDEELKVRRPMK